MLECRDVAVHYGRIEALHGVTLAIPSGKVVSIVGANGAGKTTLLRAIMGLESISRGTISYDGVDLARVPTHKITRMGIAFVPAGGSLFANLTVDQNLQLGTVARRGRAQADEHGGSIEDVLAMFPALASRLGQRVRTLSGGEQQMLVIGRALMTWPRVLLLDEPSFGLAPQVLDEILTALQALSRNGMTVVLVEQNARMALEFAELAYVLANGRAVAGGSAESLQSRTEIESVYFGGEPGE